MLKVMHKLLLSFFIFLLPAISAVYAQSAISAKELNERGSIYLKRGDVDTAIANYSRAIELDPKNVNAYGNRGVAKRQKGDLEGALADLTKAIELNPNMQSSYYARAWVNLFLNRGQAAHDDAVKLLGLKETNYLIFPSHILVGYLGLRQANRNADADLFLDSWMPKLLASAWTTQIVGYFRHKITEQQLFAQTSGNQAMTEAQTYIGMDQSLKGNRISALAHLRWVTANGDKRTFEYALAESELRRLEAPPSPRKQ